MTELLRRILITAPLCALSCTGLDPQTFGPAGRAPGVAAQAGYSFDAADELGAPGGSAGTQSSARPNAGRDSGGGTGGSASVGDGGEPAHGSGGTTPDVEAGSGNEPDSSGGVGRGGANGAGGTVPDTMSGGAGGKASGGAGGAGRGGEGGASVSSGAGGASSAGAESAEGGADGGGSGGTGGAASSGGATGAGGAGTTARTLRFGEYVEGSGSYKALELIGTPEAVLDGCRLVTYSNGSSTGSGIALSGALSATGAYTLCSSSLAGVLGTVCDRSTNLSMNGNDAVALECDGAVMDGIGQVGFDPGTAWTGASGSTANATLRLRCDTEPDRDPTDAFDPDERWLALPIDTFDGLGEPSCG